MGKTKIQYLFCLDVVVLHLCKDREYQNNLQLFSFVRLNNHFINKTGYFISKETVQNKH